MTTDQQKQLIIASRTPEVKAMLDYLLMEQGPTVLTREHEQVFKGFMMAYYAIVDLQNQTITKEE